MIRFLSQRPQLVDLALAIAFFAGFFGMLYEFANEARPEVVALWLGLIGLSAFIQWILSIRAFARNPDDFGGGLI